MSRHSFQDRIDKLSLCRRTSTGAELTPFAPFTLPGYFPGSRSLLFSCLLQGGPQRMSSLGLWPLFFLFPCQPSSWLGHQEEQRYKEPKDLSWSWGWQVCCLHLNYVCLFDVVLVEADGNYGENWTPSSWTPPNPIVIATVLVHLFFIYLKMNLRGMVEIWGGMVGKLERM